MELNEGKKIAGIVPPTPTGDISHWWYRWEVNEDIANLINHAFLEPMQEYQALDYLPRIDKNSEILKLDDYSVYSALSMLNPRKALGPDEVSNSQIGCLKNMPSFLQNPSAISWIARSTNKSFHIMEIISRMYSQEYMKNIM